MRVGFFFFKDTGPTEIYTLSLLDSIPISRERLAGDGAEAEDCLRRLAEARHAAQQHVPDPLGHFELLRPRLGPRPEELAHRSEEHTSELQSRQYLVCRLLLEKKNMVS